MTISFHYLFNSAFIVVLPFDTIPVNWGKCC